MFFRAFEDDIEVEEEDDDDFDSQSSARATPQAATARQVPIEIHCIGYLNVNSRLIAAIPAARRNTRRGPSFTAKWFSLVLF